MENSIAATGNKVKSSGKKHGFVREMKRNWGYYLMALPAVTVVFLISYLPYPGMWIAFTNFHLVRGIWGSDFVGFENFRFFFTSVHFFRTTFNTLWLNINSLLFTTIVAVTVAIVINEINKKRIARLYQNAIFFPFFLSSIVVGHILVHLLFSHDAGLANRILTSLGMDRIPWHHTPEPWVAIVVSTNVWRGAGYTSIIYLATIAGIDQEIYEAASIDGAGRLQRIFRVTLPLMVPAIITMVLLSLGGVLFGDFGLIFAIIEGDGAPRPMLFPSLDIIETFVWRSVTRVADFSTSTAVGIYQSIVGFCMVVGVNWLSKRIDSSYGLF